jgi:6,7-dimethyl-8-ribityllumazine synthase
MPHLLIITASFYDDIAASLTKGAKDALNEAGVTFDAVEVPGALEITPTIRFAIESGKYDGYVALGCVMRGETSHYDVVCNESARGLTWLAIEHQAAIGNGILTVEDEDQAWERADADKGNKGADAAKAALALIAMRAKLKGAA